MLFNSHLVNIRVICVLD
uniref:Uncharacterized protein n=1 Tax=Anguilla anguilla TaxID=7936 RepID=A0A0E9PHV2_ANGAN